ncbi:MAG: sulfatase-like hydrolase/transferase [Gammaproteobacteria bacterium]|nr:sulfatase-like hydrolase/transferase [Gammaproteobacteria bacterium]
MPLFPASSRSAARWLRVVLINRYTGVVLMLYLWGWLSAAVGGFGNHSFYTQWLELGLILYIYALLYRLLRPSRWRAVLAGVPILIFYLVHDIFFLAYSKVFRWVNVHELPELFQVLPLVYTAVIVGVFFGPLLLMLAAINPRQTRQNMLLSLPLVIILAALFYFPAHFEQVFRGLASQMVVYSDAKSVERNGRLVMSLLREAERLQVTRTIAPYRDRLVYDQQARQRATYITSQGNRHNVHMIVLESFLDPNLFLGAKFSQSPTHPDFSRFFGDTAGLSIAPMFGGATSQSEFEVLCGVPGFEKLSSIEFNVFTGSAAQCLPGILRQSGYRTIGANAYKPNFFNALTAYKGIGFGEVHFPREFYPGITYLSSGDTGVEEYQFDAELFAQNLAMVRQALRQAPDKPIFNYLMTIYGHTPHVLDPGKRPEFIRILADYQDDHLGRSTNQFYYRSKAITDYVKELIAVDKHSLIILVADHVPPLRNGPNTFKALQYLGNIEGSYYHNRILIIENGIPKKYPLLHHYDMPDVIQNYLTHGQYCNQHRCAFLQGAQRPARDLLLNDYLRLLAHASE